MCVTNVSHTWFGPAKNLQRKQYLEWMILDLVYYFRRSKSSVWFLHMLVSLFESYLIDSFILLSGTPLICLAINFHMFPKIIFILFCMFANSMFYKSMKLFLLKVRTKNLRGNILAVSLKWNLHPRWGGVDMIYRLLYFSI